MSSMLSVTEAEKLDDKHKKAGGDILNALLLAADRAVLHASSPQEFPIDPSPDSAEQLFSRYFSSRSPDKQQKAIAKTKASLGTKERAHRLGLLAAVDLKSSVPVLQQARSIFKWKALPIAQSATASSRTAPADGRRGAAAGQPDLSADDDNAVIRCRIRKVTCVDRTDPDIGDDDMIVGGAFTNDKGNSTKIDRIVLGEFNEDDRRQRVYAPPIWFGGSSVAWGVNGSLKDSSWPKEYLATIVLCEEDNGGFPDILDSLLEQIKGLVAGWAVETLGELGGEIGTALFPGLGTVVGAGLGALLGWVLDGIIGFFESWWDDDPLPAFTSTCKILGYGRAAVWTSPVRKRDIKGQGGEYKVELDWQVNWPSHFADKLDAAVAWDNGKIYLFAGSMYARYDIAEDRVDEGYPKAITAGWQKLWKDGVDAGLMWNNGKAYFFKGDEYVRVDAKTKAIDPGYPKKISETWKGLWTRDIDAAFLDRLNNKAYFFKGGEYIRYDVTKDRADDGYPLSIAAHWPDTFARDIDAAVSLGAFVYFFKGDGYVRYNLALDRAETGVRKTDRFWPGL